MSAAFGGDVPKRGGKALAERQQSDRESGMGDEARPPAATGQTVGTTDSFCAVVDHGAWRSNRNRRDRPVTQPSSCYDQKLIGGLAHERPEIVEQCASVLGARRTRLAVVALLDALARWRNADDVAIAIIYALGKMNDPRAVDPLVRVLAGGQLRQRLAATEALARLATPVARAALRRAARDDPNATVRQAAEHAATSMGEKGSR